MGSIALFAISGTAIITLVTAKMVEEKIRRPIFISKWISKSDEHIRVWHHQVLHLYSESKEKILLVINKKIKLHSKNTFNKFVTYLNEKKERYETNMRNSRLLKKSDGISEFFKSISDVEKGNGTIEETLEDSSQNP